MANSAAAATTSRRLRAPCLIRASAAEAQLERVDRRGVEGRGRRVQQPLSRRVEAIVREVKLRQGQRLLVVVMVVMVVMVVLALMRCGAAGSEGAREMADAARVLVARQGPLPRRALH